MTPTLALERLMLHPAYEQFVEQLRAVAPVGHVDQLDAATSDALRLMTDTGRAILGTSQAHGADAADIPSWLRLGLLDTLTGWADGRASTCRHQPTPDRPQPVIAAAWKPGLVTCPGCVYLTALPRNSVRDRTCDACGRECAGPQHGDGIYPGMVQLGPLIYQYGTCGDCRPSTASGNPLSATLPAEQDSLRGTGRVQPRGSRGRRRGKGGRR
ncbi:hypothetical protein [Micromonospora sp. NPDC005413]|uniref:hypothetical protein n=1 Tax=Micromonospora sp. NPDC005413 TaxID=3154563 RepID=UPI00339DDA7D